jgi:DNA-binding LacI/PurR family transcriptional regulator
MAITFVGSMLFSGKIECEKVFPSLSETPILWRLKFKKALQPKTSQHPLQMNMGIVFRAKAVKYFFMSKHTGRPPGPQAAYKALGTQMQACIDSGRWSPGLPIPSMRALTAEYNCGLQVVRLALHQLRKQGLLVKDNRRRLAVASSQKHQFALRGAVCLILPTTLKKTLDNTCFCAMRRGIEHALGPTQLLIAHHWYFRETRPADLAELPLSGLLLTGPIHPRCLSSYTALPIPKVLVDHPPHPGFSSVSADNQQAAYDATLRLIEAGHKRIAFFRRVRLYINNVDPDAKERTAGFQKACADGGVELAADAIKNVCDHDLPHAGVFKSLFESQPPFTAAIASDPGIAQRIVNAAQTHGKQVPRDLSVVAFHAAIDKSGWSGPAIDFEAIGRKAVALLKERAPHQARLRAHWDEGGTLAPPRFKNTNKNTTSR